MCVSPSCCGRNGHLYFQLSPSANRRERFLNLDNSEGTNRLQSPAAPSGDLSEVCVCVCLSEDKTVEGLIRVTKPVSHTTIEQRFSCPAKFL